ncbi:signal peptidase I [Parvularcula lutaonensis]|uniref:Signal peptidase I n=1 Tax=Parvularcula lutaonensis TaxID=491923 RepID=A0ABV7MF58_9PROT|nr:signal peptidase I [Parvularcula lutaonensis]GGY52613.1 signal peptidase I [Parvularcula lutaonensis]
MSEGQEQRSVRVMLEEAWDVSKTVVIAVGITLFVRFFFIQPFNIPSASMEPTLMTGDFILVDKIDYGYSKASLIFPLTRLPLEGRMFSDMPQRGEVAVFKNANDRNKDYVKRIVGLPGDTIQVIGGVLHVNGQAVTREPIPDPETTCEGYSPQARRYRETLPGGPTYIVQECDGNRGAADNTAPKKVPEGHYFAMGDNRDRSLDSRSTTVNFVPHDALVGHARRVIFSVDGDKARFYEVWKWPFAIRYERIGDKVE